MATKPAEYNRQMHGATFIGKDLGWVEFRDSTIQPQYPPTDSWEKSDTTLYLGIASLRDKLCPHTLFNAYSKAAYPNRLFIGVVQQNAPEDVDCFEEYCNLMMKSLGKTYTGDAKDCPHAKNIRMLRVSSTQAKGPTWGRAKASTLLQDEEFCMQTDAHMDFVPKWDTKMMKMWASTGNEYAVISTYVADSEQLEYNIKEDSKGLNNLNEVPHLCMVTLDGAHGLVRVWGTKCARDLPKPKLTNAIWGAGLSFSKCHAERKAAYDPHTPFIFDGEEFSRAVRFWTWGYDIYTPNRVYVVHNYHLSQSDPNHFDWYRSAPDPTEGTVEQSIMRLRTLFGMPGGGDAGQQKQLHESKYGLGDRRTYDQLIAFSGIDTRNHKIIENRCGNIDLVPFKEHPWGADYIPKFDPTTEAFMDVRDPGSVLYDSTKDSEKWEAAKVARSSSHQIQPPSSSSSSSSSSISSSVVIKNGALLTLRRSDNSEVGKGAGDTDRVMMSQMISDGTGQSPQRSSKIVMDSVSNRIDSTLGILFLFIIVGIAMHFFRHKCHVGKHSRLAFESLPDNVDTAIKTV